MSTFEDTCTHIMSICCTEKQICFARTSLRAMLAHAGRSGHHEGVRWERVHNRQCRLRVPTCLVPGSHARFCPPNGSQTMQRESVEDVGGCARRCHWLPVVGVIGCLWSASGLCRLRLKRPLARPACRSLHRQVNSCWSSVPSPTDGGWCLQHAWPRCDPARFVA